MVEGGRQRDESGGVRVAFSRWHLIFFSKMVGRPTCCVVERSTGFTERRYNTYLVLNLGFLTFLGPKIFVGV